MNKYFELVKDLDFVTNIELKTGINQYLGIEEKVYKLIKEYKLEKKVIISSFNHFSVLRMKKIAPELKCGFLSEDWIIDAGAYTASHGIECFHPRFNILIGNYPDLVKKIINENK